MPDNEIPPIKITAVVGGLDAIKQSFRNIEQMAEAHETKLRQIYEQNELKKKQLTQNAMKQLERISVDDTNKRIKVSEDYHRKLEQIEAREALKIRQLKENQEAQLTKITERGIEARARAEQRSRANRNQNIGVLGSAVAGSLGGLGGFFNVQAGISASNLAGGGAMGLLAGTGTVAGLLAIKEAFEVVSFGAKEFTQAILEIGGGFAVSTSLVKASKNERAAAETATQVRFGGGTATAADINNLATRTAKGTEFSKAQMIDAIRKFQEKTGNIEGFGDFAPFMQGAAIVTSTDVADVAGRMGSLKAAFNSLTPEQLMQLTRRGIAQGAKGSVEFKDMAGLGKATGFAGSMSGDLVENIAKQMAMVQLAEPILGSVDESVTAISSFNTQFLKKNQLGAKFKDGKLNNFDEVLQNAVFGFIKNPMQFRSEDIKDVRAIRGIGAIAGRFSSFEKEKEDEIGRQLTSKEKSETFKEFFESFSKANITMEQFNDGVSEISDTVDHKLKVVFNKITDEVGTELLPYLQKFSDALIDNLPSVEDGIKNLVSIIEFGVHGLGEIFGFAISAYKLKEQVSGGLERNALENDQKKLDELKGRKDEEILFAGRTVGQERQFREQQIAEEKERLKSHLDVVQNIESLQDWLNETPAQVEAKKQAAKQKRHQERLGSGEGVRESMFTETEFGGISSLIKMPQPGATKSQISLDKLQDLSSKQYTEAQKQTIHLARIADKIDPDKPLANRKPNNGPPNTGGGFGNPYQ